MSQASLTTEDNHRTQWTSDTRFHLNQTMLGRPMVERLFLKDSSISYLGQDSRPSNPGDLQVVSLPVWPLIDLGELNAQCRQRRLTLVARADLLKHPNSAGLFIERITLLTL